MSRKEIKGFKGGFIPPELKSSEPRGRNESTQNWQSSSDREESLSDLGWLKRPPTKGKKGNPEVQKSPQQEHDTQTATPVRDAREVLSTKKNDTSKKSNFPKITFPNTNTSGNRTDRITSGYNMRRNRPKHNRIIQQQLHKHLHPNHERQQHLHKHPEKAQSQISVSAA